MDSSLVRVFSTLLTAAILLFVAFTIPQHAIAQPEFVAMNVYTDKVTYTPDDNIVNIKGCVHSATSSLEGQQVTIQIFDPSNNVIASEQVLIDDTCNFNFPLDINQSKTGFGNYLVSVSYSNQTTETAFRFSDESNAKKEGECNIDYCTYYFELYAKIYPIQYQVTSGRVVAMFVDFPARALMVITNSSGDGLLTIVLPREIIDSKQDNGMDKEYFVSIGEYAQGSGSREVEFQEPRLTFEIKESRLLQIEYPAGYMQIQIAGTYFVPEFDVPIVSVAMIAVVASVTLTRKLYRSVRRTP